jgi:acetyl esterase/lipase
MNYLASRGWVCVTANYRLSPKATWPDHIIDVKSALIWTKQHIHEYGGDPGFIAVTGGSAGGHLSSLLALTPNKPEWQPWQEDFDTSVQACVPHYGVYDMADILQLRGGVRQRDMFLGPSVFKSKYSDDPAPYLDASPLEHVNADAPPFLVVHGANDSLASVEEARVFVERLRAVSKETVTYIELPGTQHAFDVFHSLTSATVVRGVGRWLEQVRADHAARYQSSSV